ncbi:hypothetical protein Ciccas_006238 [Cichlidogyrus casuarinus]|uniref:Phosphatidic acid phosphatase type 2/haloperoxidase domain-containing protein n=1 Tax=Cichlidogyrus casuarinus TaxID=1844966 RepID=A0ABD2Q6B1_9PLAT
MTVLKIYQATFAFALGYSLNLLLTIVAKSTVGRLRPHFLDLCKPLANATVLDYVTKFNCTRTVSIVGEKIPLEKLFVDMRKSFPSGHSSVAMFNAVYLTVYIGTRMPSKRIFLGLGYLLQSIVLASGIFVCCSRMMDYKHHWSDVLAGSLLGTLVAFFIVSSSILILIFSHISLQNVTT